ncbi:hypothetical protein MCERE19_02408 [Spirosomataceae bacterium]
MLNFLKYYKWKFKSLFQDERNGVLLGKLLTKQNVLISNVKNLSEVEFKVFSQFGEDGIIQYLLSKLNIKNTFFIEFGVENYLESNTRFLLINNNWSGLVIDGDKSNVDFIKKDNIYWRHRLLAVQSFITKDNINNILCENIKNIDNIGLLSIDIDGNDYWIWKEIDFISPIIIIAEFNNLFGNERAVTIPYDENFTRKESHYSHLYFGCSLPALYLLAEEKGYDFVGVNNTCMNAFFIRKDFSEPFYKPSINEVFTNTSIRESRNEKGQLSHLERIDSLKLIAELPIFCIDTGSIVTIKEALSI